MLLFVAGYHCYLYCYQSGVGIVLVLPDLDCLLIFVTLFCPYCWAERRALLCFSPPTTSHHTATMLHGFVVSDVLRLLRYGVLQDGLGWPLDRCLFWDWIMGLLLLPPLLLLLLLLICSVVVVIVIYHIYIYLFILFIYLPFALYPLPFYPLLPSPLLPTTPLYTHTHCLLAHYPLPPVSVLCSRYLPFATRGSRARSMLRSSRCARSGAHFGLAKRRF